MQAEQRLAGTDGLGPAGFTIATLQQVVFGNRNLSAELARATHGRRVHGERPGGPRARRARCSAAWDGRADIDSRGEVLWREYWSRLVERRRAVDDRVRPERPGRARRAAIDGGRPEGAHRADRRGRGPARQGHRARRAARRAAGRAARQRADPDPRLHRGRGLLQHHLDRPRRAGPLRPVHGLLVRDDGGVRLAAAGRTARRSSPTRSRRTRGREHYADQTRLFSQKQWVPMRFTEREIRGDANYKRTVVTGRG